MIEIYYKENKIVNEVVWANNFWDRLVGYMFRAKPHVPGILLEPAPSIHTFFMFFSIDVIFIDKENRIIKVYRNLKPWRHTRFFFKSRKALELPGGSFSTDINEGEILEIRNV